MLITRESDYAVRIVRALSDSALRTIQEICDEEKLPKQFAYKILKKLSDADLVEIKRGTSGGCRLKKPLEKINLLMIMQATDENFLLGPCLQHTYGCAYRESCGHCSVHQELHRVQEVLEQELSRYTMQELLNKS